MTTGEAAKRLGKDRQTIVNWLTHEVITDMFSPAARGDGVRNRTLNDDDFAILATIFVLRDRENVHDWNDIRAFLDTGQRYTQPNLDGVTVQTETVSRPYAEQSAKAAATLAERDAALARVEDLESEVSRLYAEMERRLKEQADSYEERIEKLYERIGDLREEIGKLKANSDNE